jgi:AmmeMemoRadiSam system protein B
VTAEASIRRPAVSGMFYPENPEALRRQVQQLFDRAPRRSVAGHILGIVSPHAGYLYSGLTAAAAYGLVAGTKVETVVVVSPSHREYFAGVSVYPGDGYETPLGSVPVDQDLREELVKVCPLVRSNKVGHGEEHAIEVQLPFLQQTLGEFKLLPLVMGDQSRATCMTLGKRLGAVVRGKNAVLVASTDLSHYHSSRVAEAMDSVMIEDVKRFDEDQLMTDLESGTTEACGGGPTVAVMAALKVLGASHMEVVHHCNSGDITGDTRSVVGYLSAVAWA